MATYKKPYTHNGQYFAGDSGLSEDVFKQQRAAGTLGNRDDLSPNGGTTNYNTPAGNTVDLRLPNSTTGSGTVDAPWYSSQNQATPEGIFGVNQPTAQTGLTGGSYQNPAATNPLGSSQVWNKDPNLSKVSGAIPQMLGYDENTGKYASGPGSLVGGPGQAYSPSMLANIYGLGAQALRHTNQANTAGIATANAARGGAGPNTANLMAGRDAQDRGALARGNLDAQQKGLELGVNQYNAQAGVFGNIGNLANAEAERGHDTQRLDFAKKNQDKQALQTQVQQAQNAMNNFVNSHAAELNQSSGSKTTGKQSKDYFRKELQDLQRQYQTAQANLSQYA